jgi:hypothetical protein
MFKKQKQVLFARSATLIWSVSRLKRMGKPWRSTAAQIKTLSVQIPRKVKGRTAKILKENACDRAILVSNADVNILLSETTTYSVI